MRFWATRQLTSGRLRCHLVLKIPTASSMPYQEKFMRSSARRKSARTQAGLYIWRLPIRKPRYTRFLTGCRSVRGITSCYPLRQTMERTRGRRLRFCTLTISRSRMRREMSLRQTPRQRLCRLLQETTARTLQASREQWILRALRQRATAGRRAALP